MIHRHQCAAITNGCKSFVVYESRSREPNLKLLRLNGWHLDHGRWVCGLHEAVCEPSPPAMALRPAASASGAARSLDDVSPDLRYAVQFCHGCQGITGPGLYYLLCGEHAARAAAA